MALLNIFKSDASKRSVLSRGHVVSESSRCVQCGVCSFNCPIGINVRAHVWRNEPVDHSECLTCGECVARCPRGVLSFAQIDMFARREE